MKGESFDLKFDFDSLIHKKRGLNTLNMKSLVRKTRILDILWILSPKKEDSERIFRNPSKGNRRIVQR